MSVKKPTESVTWPGRMNTGQQRRDVAAYNTQRRLLRLQEKLEGIRDALIRIHRDESGMQRSMQSMPLLESEWNGKAGFTERFARVLSDAAQGCELSAGFIAEWQEVATLCDQLRHFKPPEAAPGYFQRPIKRAPMPPRYSAELRSKEGSQSKSSTPELPDDWELEALMEEDNNQRGKK